jgi:hypothetical protein
MLQEPDHLARDASGNIRLNDIGVFLRDQIARRAYAIGDRSGHRDTCMAS